MVAVACAKAAVVPRATAAAFPTRAVGRALISVELRVAAVDPRHGADGIANEYGRFSDEYNEPPRGGGRPLNRGNEMCVAAHELCVDADQFSSVAAAIDRWCKSNQRRGQSSRRYDSPPFTLVHAVSACRPAIRRDGAEDFLVRPGN